MGNQVSVVKFHDGDRAVRPATSKGGGAECVGIGSVRPSLQFDRHFSSADDFPSRRRATISCWICWVPSKMSRIFESRPHFSSNGRCE